MTENEQKEIENYNENVLGESEENEELLTENFENPDQQKLNFEDLTEEQKSEALKFNELSIAIECLCNAMEDLNTKMNHLHEKHLEINVKVNKIVKHLNIEV